MENLTAIRMKLNKFKKEQGFSLIELLIAAAIFTILAAFVLIGFSGKGSGGKKTLQLIEQSLRERQTSAVRLASANKTSSVAVAPLVINFADETTTARLKIDGVDLDRNGFDDNSGTKLTRWLDARQAWDYAYEGSPLKLPTGWVVVTSAEEFGDIPQIPNSRFTTEITFDADGRPPSIPVSPTKGKDEKKLDEAPFWAIYLKDVKADDIAVAVAVHGSGLVEGWTFDFSRRVWTGNGGRANE